MQPRDRRAMMQPPSASYSAATLQHLQQQQQQQQQSAYLNMGLSMTMSDMESSIRAYQPHPHPGMAATTGGSTATHDATSVGYWRPTMDPNSNNSAPYKPQNGGLELAFGEMLTNQNSTAMDERTPEDGHMAAVMGAAPYEMTSFAEPMGMNSGSGGGNTSGVPRTEYQVGPSGLVIQQPQQQPQQQSQRPPGHASDQDDPMTTPIATSGATGPPQPRADGSQQLGASAEAGTASTGDYSRFVDAREEPDLTQRKIDEKNEKCQFHHCPNRARVLQAYGKFCNRHVIVAPCGFPGCRDKALVNSSMCEKHLAQGKEALHHILASRAQNVPVCRTFGCFKNDQGRGYCRGHEKLLMATGRLPKHINKRRLNSAYTMCSYPDCQKHSQRNHLCRTHGNMIMKQAEELAATTSDSYEDILARLQKDIRRCTHPSCTKNSQRDRLCTMHYYEKHNLSRDGQPQNAGSSPSSSAHGGEDALMTTPTGSSHAKSPVASAKDVSMLRDVERTQCSTPGCEHASSQTSGLCLYHEKQANQMQHLSGSAARGGLTTCQLTNCMNPVARPGELCVAHERVFGGANSSCSSSSSFAPRNNSMSGTEAASAGENEAKQALFILNGKRRGTGEAYAAAVDNGRSTKCSNPMCARETDGRDYCESCQSLFSPLVVSVGDQVSSSGASWSQADSVAMQQQQQRVLTETGWDDGGIKFGSNSRECCRVKDCPQISARGGLCEAHIRSFEDGSLSVDELTLRSRQITERQEQAWNAAVAAANEAKLQNTSPMGGSSKMKKYFCRMDGCDKQAQKRGLCKRHFRLQSEGVSGPSASGLMSENVVPSSCQFAGCSQSTAGSGSATLCVAHSRVSLCWHPTCNVLVRAPQFCETHAMQRQCAFEGCSYSTSSPSVSGCMHHVMAPRCRHEHCEKFVVGNGGGDRCRVHQLSCDKEPCALCIVHGLRRHAGRSGTIDMQQQQYPKENVPGRSNDIDTDGKAFASASSVGVPSSYRETRLI